MSDDFEKFKNFVMFNMHVTNRERDEIFSSPAFGVVLLIVVVLAILGVIFL